jgi:hypothetical protein
MCVCRVYLCVNVVDLHIMRKHPNYWKFQKKSHSIKFYEVDHVKGLWFFVKLVKQSIGN